MKMKEHKERTASRQGVEEKNNNKSVRAFLMMTEKLKWMLQLLCIYTGWSNENALPSSSPSPQNLPVTIFFFTPPNQNLPVSSLPQLLPNVLKTG